MFDVTTLKGRPTTVTTTLTGRPTTERVHVDLIDDARAFAALRPDWADLLRNSAVDSPFLTWEWLSTWWTRLSGSRRLRLLAVREDEKLVAVAPMALSRTRFDLFPALEFLGTGDAGSDYLDVVIRRGHEGEALRALASCLDEQGLPLRLDRLPPASIASRLADHLGARGWSSMRDPNGVCPFIRLSGHTWESYLQSLGAAHRANVRRRLNGITKQFDVRFERVETDADRRDVLSALWRFHADRFSTRGGSTAFDTADLREFHADAMRAMHDAGWLRLYALRLNGETAAAMYAFAYDRRFYFYQHGFDARFRPQSVGLVLMALTIKAAIDEQMSEFDMLYGTESYKALWARHRRPLERIALFPAHIGGRLHHNLASARRTVRQLAKRILKGTPQCLPDDRLAGAGA